MYIAVTRPFEDTSKFIQQADFLSHVFLPSPLLQIAPLDITSYRDKILKASCLLITSANAIPILKKQHLMQDIKNKTLFAIGIESAKTAQSYGFTNIISANSSIESLIQIFCDYYQKKIPSELTPVYLSGAHTSVDLVAKMNQFGYHCHRYVLYEAKAVQYLPEKLHLALQKNLLQAVVLFSVRTAKVLIECLERQNQIMKLKKLYCFCLSQKVSDVMKEYKPYEIIVAKNPNTASIIKALGNYQNQDEIS